MSTTDGRDPDHIGERPLASFSTPQLEAKRGELVQVLEQIHRELTSRPVDPAYAELTIAPGYVITSVTDMFLERFGFRRGELVGQVMVRVFRRTDAPPADSDGLERAVIQPVMTGRLRYAMLSSWLHRGDTAARQQIFVEMWPHGYRGMRMRVTSLGEPVEVPEPDALPTLQFQRPSFMVARDGTFLSVSDALCDLLGYARQELVGLLSGALLRPGEDLHETEPEIVDLMRQVREGPRAAADCDFWVVTRDRQRRLRLHATVTWQPTYDAWLMDAAVESIEDLA